VSPEQGERLILAASDGKIQLALRNTLDLAEVPTGGLRSDALLARPATKAGPESENRNAVRRPAPVDAATVVEAYRGGVRTLIKF
jgi:pilus assembly protein CpaB